jgi:hypothetical protein
VLLPEEETCEVCSSSRTRIGRASACRGVSLCAAELRLRAGMDQPVLARRAASADGSLMMITCEWDLASAVVLRLTDACRSLIGPRDVGARGALGGVRGQYGAARCGQNCGQVGVLAATGTEVVARALGVVSRQVF